MMLKFTHKEYTFIAAVDCFSVTRLLLYVSSKGCTWIHVCIKHTYHLKGLTALSSILVGW